MPTKGFEEPEGANVYEPGSFHETPEYIRRKEKELMPTKRLTPTAAHSDRLDPNERRNFCQDPEHEPPTMRVFAPGTYEHTCPGCGHKGTFTISKGPTL